MSAGVPRIAIADTGLVPFAGAAETHARLGSALDAFQVAGDLPHRGAGPWDLGDVHDGSPGEGGQTKIFDSTSPERFVHVNRVDLSVRRTTRGAR